MRMSKKVAAILAGVTVGAMGHTLAASADSFTDVPKDHWSYEALDYLAREGIIEGMGDSTFQGGRAMSRYEMASIVAKAMQKGSNNFGDKAVLDKLSAEYAGELDTLKKRVDAHDKDIKELKEKAERFQLHGLARVQMGNDNGLKNDGYGGDYNNRFYMDLEGSLKVNPYMTARFTVEKNARFRDREYLTTKVVKTKDGQAYTVDRAVSGEDRDNVNNDANHNGSISNIWVELALGKNHDWYTNIGRKWNGIGMQNLLLGGQVDGIATYHAIPKGHGWWFSAQYFKPSADWSQTVETVEKNKAGVYEVTDTKHYTNRAPISAVLDFWGPLGKYVDANVAYARVIQHNLDENDTNSGFYSGAKNFYGIDLKVKPVKDLAITGSFVKSDADVNKPYNNWAQKGHANRDLAVKIEYKGTDINKPGSYGLYAKWVDLGCLADLGHDDEWATREPTGINGVRGWYYGFKVVPWKNVEWETMYANLTENTNNSWAGATTHNRRILRSWLDFHF
ncbi:MAG: S-layer homology domain-containing protein [Selenomonas ruminantium]|uniref:S-layer homology domain-containing protein n=1 Tax=Selenomonas ruminantium TaxID=971 RepID=A0A927ZRQ2_SELRU|nr:S-layer homology domain-containing protein [Selenomonas ruminantium]